MRYYLQSAFPLRLSNIKTRKNCQHSPRPSLKFTVDIICLRLGKNLFPSCLPQNYWNEVFPCLIQRFDGRFKTGNISIFSRPIQRPDRLDVTAIGMNFSARCIATNFCHLSSLAVLCRPACRPAFPSPPPLTILAEVTVTRSSGSCTGRRPAPAPAASPPPPRRLLFSRDLKNFLGLGTTSPSLLLPKPKVWTFHLGKLNSLIILITKKYQ